MEGFYVSRNNESKEKISKAGEKLELLAKGDGVEVMLQTLKPNILISISPGEDENLMECFYILSGVISYEHEGENILLKEGEHFYSHKLKGNVYMRCITEVKLLYVASQPVYNMLRSEIVELNNILKELVDKDIYTYDHNIRLRDYSIRIGEALGIPKERIEMLHYAALFHDVGKINTPDEILKKPGKLSTEEFEIIKNHPMDGKLLMDKTFLFSVGKIISQHHERLNGSGYPMGLKGDEISLEAKIIAVADSYDAMTTNRPYHIAKSPKVAIKDIKSLIGSHYDEKIVKTFERILKSDGTL
jgi:HD-GYP domain-containing protein (c-di-GMP phosphodiesterase class II)